MSPTEKSFIMLSWNQRDRRIEDMKAQERPSSWDGLYIYIHMSSLFTAFSTSKSWSPLYARVWIENVVGLFTSTVGREGINMGIGL